MLARLACSKKGTPPTTAGRRPRRGVSLCWLFGCGYAALWIIVLMTRGVDLLADPPVGAYLLDAMVEYVRSEGFVTP